MEAVELIFRLDRIKALNLAGIAPEDAWFFLSREVHRRPKVLELHVGRIRAAAALDPEATYAALLDLMTVLQERGRALRWRLFRQVRDRLSGKCADELYRYLNAEIPLSHLPFSPRAVLHPGVVGKLGAGESNFGGRKP